MAGLRQVEAELGAFGREEAVRDLGQDAATVAERGIGPDRAAMVEIDQDLQALFEDVVRLAVLHVGDEADAAGIVLLGGIVEALGGRGQRVRTDTDLLRSPLSPSVAWVLAFISPLPAQSRSGATVVPNF